MNKEEYYTYEETLKIIEWYMDETGIRSFCTRYCKGDCCANCYHTEKACHKNEGRRLSCSVFICNPLERILFPDINKRELYFFLQREVSKCLYDTGKLKGNEYFSIHTKAIQERFIMRKFKLDKFLEHNKIEDIRMKVNVIKYLGSKILRGAKK